MTNSHYSNWTLPTQARRVLADQLPHAPVVLTDELEEERRLFVRLCPYYANGSRHGVAEYLDTVAERSGVSKERVGYAFRTQPTLLYFLAAL